MDLIYLQVHVLMEGNEIKCLVPLCQQIEYAWLNYFTFRAWEYFTDSIFNKKLYACQSTSYIMYKMKSYCTKPVAFGQYANPQYVLRVTYFILWFISIFQDTFHAWML